MAPPERRGQLTYERLISSLERHRNAINVQLPDLKDAGRTQDLLRAISDTCAAAHAGMSGALDVSPAQLKQVLKARIADIHEQHAAIDEAEAHTQGSTVSLSGTRDAQNSARGSSQPVPAPKRTRGARDSSKENAVPAASPSSQPAPRKLSAVRKTSITRRATSTKPRSTASVKKRSTRTTRSKAAVQDVPTTPLPFTDEADRRAAAAALLGLADHSPHASFTFPTSRSSATPPPTAGSSRKRTHTVSSDNAPSQPTTHPTPQDSTESPPAPKKRAPAPATYAPVPELARGLSAPEVFVLGVEYVVQHLPPSLQCDGEAMRAWVETGLGLRDAPQLHGSHARNLGDGVLAAAVTVPPGSGSVGVARKGFWDVV